MEFLAGGSLEEGGDAALVVGVGADRAWDRSGDHLVAVFGDWLDDYLDAADFSGKSGQVLTVPGAGAVPFGSVVLVGLGEDPDAEAVRNAAGTAGRSLSRAATVATTLHEHPGGAEAIPGVE